MSALSLTTPTTTGRRATVAAIVAVAALCAAGSSSATPRVVIRTPGFPNSVYSAFGSVWATSHRGGYLYRIDPASNKVTTIAVADALCDVPIAAEGKLWVSGCDIGQTAIDGFTYQVDPKTNRVVRRIVGSDPNFAAGSIWTIRGHSIDRIDPKSGIVLVSIRVPGAHPDAITEWGIGGVADGSIWAITDATIVRISTTTNAVTNVIPLPNVGNAVFAEGETGPSPIAALAGKIWFTQYPFLYKVDPRTNVATATPLHAGPFSQWGDGSLVAHDGSLWLRTTDTQVVQIDPATSQITARYPAGGGGGGITVAFASLWIANAGSNDVWRIPLARS